MSFSRKRKPISGSEKVPDLYKTGLQRIKYILRPLRISFGEHSILLKIFLSSLIQGGKLIFIFYSVTRHM